MMRTVLAALFCVVSATMASAAPAGAAGGRDYAETMLLTSESDHNVRMAAKVLHVDGKQRAASLELLAEVVWEACAGKCQMEPDALAWAAKAIGASGQARYAALLDYCLGKVSDGKSVRYLTEARSALPAGGGGSLTGGRVNLAQVRDQAVRTSRPRSAQVVGQFDALRKGQTIDEVYAALGRPDEVQAETITGRKMGHGPVQIRDSRDAIAFVYRGAGTIRFAHDEDKGGWRVADGTSEKDLYWSQRGGGFGTLAEWVATGNETDLIKISELLRHDEKVEREVLDRVADRIYELQEDPDDDVADALAYLCKNLAKSGDGRYKQFLEKVGDTAGDKTLRKHARKAANSLPDSREPAYVPAKARK
jgi:hypothetical protein